MEAILSDIEGIQRIRGMAGSGKTIVLARKAVELHTAHPDWNIVVTYYTRSLKGQFENLISRFYATKNDGAKYNDKKLKIMQSWGSAESRGVYYEICLQHGISPLSLNEAKAKYGVGANYFSKMCENLLVKIKNFNKMYDCILIDEAQDFDKNYLKLCSKIVGNQERLIYAYDELQALNEEQMPNPKDIFGHDIENDTPLITCYRNQGAVIVTAHAIGMGLYRKEGLVQLPSSIDVWNSIGYFSDNPINEGEEVKLYRTKETSPDFLEVSNTEIIKFKNYTNEINMYHELLSMLSNDMYHEQLLVTDIMIIDMDKFNYINNVNKFIKYIKQINEQNIENNIDPFNIKIHYAGATTPEDFFRNESIVYSSVRRAKGNESFVVYIINAQKCVNSLQRRSDRNALFTAITRSKGWVRVLGYGNDMKILCDEFEEIKKQNFQLYFQHYPTKIEQKNIFLNNKDAATKDVKTLDKTKELINRLSKDNKMTKVQIMQQLFEADRDELIKILQESNDE